MDISLQADSVRDFAVQAPTALRTFRGIFHISNPIGEYLPVPTGQS